MSGRPVKHSVTLKGHRTSVSLEDDFWREFRAIAERKDMAINALVIFCAVTLMYAPRGSSMRSACSIREENSIAGGPIAARRGRTTSAGASTITSALRRWQKTLKK